MSAHRSLSLQVVERNAVTLALADLVGSAVADLLRTLPPESNRAAVARLAPLLDTLARSAAQGRRIARRLSLALAREAP